MTGDQSSAIGWMALAIVIVLVVAAIGALAAVLWGVSLVLKLAGAE